MNHNDKFSPNSDSGISSSSSEIMGTPFDLAAPRFEYPFPPAQDSPTDAFPASVTPQPPHWPIHISKSFPLTPPPLGKLKAHPKLRSANAREPPVPPGLVKRRSRIAGLQHQSSSEEPSDRSDIGEDVRTQRPTRPHPLQSDIKHAPAPSSPGPAGLAGNAQVLRPKSIPVHEHVYLFAVQCALLAGQLCHWFLRLLGFSRA